MHSPLSPKSRGFLPPCLGMEMTDSICTTEFSFFLFASFFMQSQKLLPIIVVQTGLPISIPG